MAKEGQLLKWSGLTKRDGGLIPEFALIREIKDPARQPKLEVRFSTQPPELEKGSIHFRVSVMSGSDERAEELAYRQLTHSGKAKQVVKFTLDDFEHLPDESQFEAFVRVSVPDFEEIEAVESEEFLLRFRQEHEEDMPESNAAQRVRCLVEGAIQIADVSGFDAACVDGKYEYVEAKGLVKFSAEGMKKSVAVNRPSLVTWIEQHSLNLEPGARRWVVRTRPDGSRVADPVPVELPRGDVPEEAWDRAVKSARRLREETKDRGGFWGRIWAGDQKTLEEVVNAWAVVLESGSPELALIDTLEVQSQDGSTLGLVVLPSHPLRLAWHQAYDQLARHARYTLNLDRKDVCEALAPLEAEHIPAILPGLKPDEQFLFADTLGFYVTVMVSDCEKEPKAAVSRIMKCLGALEPERIATGSLRISDVLAKEVGRYIEFHELAKESNGLVQLHAIRPGDGATVVRALGKTFREYSPGEDLDDNQSVLRFNLELFPSDPQSDVTGSFLADVVERHRTGAAGISQDDRWMLQSKSHSSGLTFPRLRWARKDEAIPDRASHVAMAFDTFQTRVAFKPESTFDVAAPLHAWGLTPVPQRDFELSPGTRWTTWLPPMADGIKHPEARGLTERIHKLHRAVLKSVVKQAGRSVSDWPVLVTELPPDKQDELKHMHDRADWVISVDRYAGVEYFDSPRENKPIYDAYVIDCVPERNDLGSLQMITSTSRSAEVRVLLDEMLSQMSLSSSRKNCEFLINQLKALSGRLAMRLASPSDLNRELIALALLQANCSNPGSECWPDLRQGFFVPVDDVRDLAPVEKQPKNAVLPTVLGVRCDMIYVTAAPRSGLFLRYIEVKYRRHVRAARDPELIEHIAEQVEGHRDRWNDWYFSDELSPVEASVRRSRLVRALNFYLEKGHRHSLEDKAFERLRKELDRMVTEEVCRVRVDESQTLGFIFCPEVTSGTPEEVTRTTNGSVVWLFGPAGLPDLVNGRETPTLEPSHRSVRRVPEARQKNSEPVDVPPIQDADKDTPAEILADISQESVATVIPVAEIDAVELESVDESVVVENANAEPSQSEPIATSDQFDSESTGPATSQAVIRLGEDALTRDPVTWNAGIKGNPHLMIVGLPGMGKTVALINICQQLVEQRITPIVFSYHPDIDDRLAAQVSGVRLLDHQQLGFNPLQVDGESKHGHIDNAGILRDIFAAMYPEFGDVQLSRIRSAIVKSYTDLGWGTARRAGTPEFRAFFDLMQDEEKPDATTRNIVSRLEELKDYGVFDTSGAVRSLLSSNEPSVLRIHATQNENVQKAVAMLGLYNIYKEMFRRGEQQRITHAVVFDEAHRASRLRLIPRLAAECRKFGVALIVASQSARDFDPVVYSQVANYLLLRLTEQDAKQLAKNITTSDQARRVADRVKQLPKFQALFFREGLRVPNTVLLSAPNEYR